MLFIKAFIDNPLNWLIGIFGIGSVYFVTQTYPIFAQASYTFTQKGFINFIGSIVCILLTIILFVFSIKDKLDKTRKEIEQLNSTIAEQNFSLKQKDENVKGLIQDRNDLKNERNENRITISNLEYRIEMQGVVFKSLTENLDRKELIKLNKEIPLMTQNLSIGENNHNDR
ncbi:hypothetical protein [uncultured Leuconostoc sp.]|uniref:hypothetical protein n=1 Tax=uncultured Leuconostoc sp. TaxID=173262 RepID=UPI00259763A2|nr:hypothetical protein [uncultured Leuconostoc sp.]